MTTDYVGLSIPAPNFLSQFPFELFPCPTLPLLLLTVGFGCIVERRENDRHISIIQPITMVLRF